MIFEKHVSRRGVLRGMGGALGVTLGRLGAMQEPPPYSISALLDGSGMARIRAGEFAMGSADGPRTSNRPTGCI